MSFFYWCTCVTVVVVLCCNGCYTTHFKVFFNILGGTDYNGVSETIVFDQDTNQTQLRVTFINDDVLEPNERLQLLLNSSDDNVILNPETAEVNILDDDGELFVDVLCR